MIRNVWRHASVVFSLGVLLFTSAFSNVSAETGRQDIPSRQSAARPGGQQKAWAENEIVVKLKPGTKVDSAFLAKYKIQKNTKVLESLGTGFAGAQAKSGNKPARQLEGLENYQVLTLASGSDASAVAAQVKKDTRVELAEPNYKLSAIAAPNDPGFVVVNSSYGGQKNSTVTVVP